MGTSDGSPRANIFAAGSILWRRSPSGDSGVEVALVHRPKYDDWSFPKGKLDPGETAVDAAVREVKEETGFDSRLGRSLSYVTYPIPGHRRVKKVLYWAAEVTGGEFVPNVEVDELRWVAPEDVGRELSYPMDHKILRRFVSKPADTSTVLLVRHGSAGSRSRFKGNDVDRPLDRTGRRQAQSLVSLLRAFGGDSVYAADRARCVQTVAPFAESLGVDITPEHLLSEEGYADDPRKGRHRARDIAELPGTPVVCSQGKVIPDLMRWWAEKDGITLPANRNRKGSVWVLSRRDGRLIAADHIASPLPTLTADG
ncbi:NUDIX hydrolase [Rhodococcus sp. 06-418-5]|uniref:NUDIX hydrolase n=1 Tax=Rhodococcus sp. 06-418-5 TaxID=2022507 RepID=UPI000B9A9701|nr:NUDIX hydrolase [Rhodococcus sp. 06-418-5]OZC82707.1 NUDIX hydrolase [Rhodococcus sp. 06-418-5]